ncbi:hypothetical protein Pmani_033009 [Petrolisthes manimaculis]|uniref:Ig-like domain-containing protein n=1 Tax=Petrolisthes manimaculis TaxID=1843537 RepID=A0AAE1TR28_9EUCA|nr:hypothetical protein Pmani_033009 [Petrolisthes manimaculis]
MRIARITQDEDSYGDTEQKRAAKWDQNEESKGSIRRGQPAGGHVRQQSTGTPEEDNQIMQDKMGTARGNACRTQPGIDSRKGSLDSSVHWSGIEERAHFNTDPPNQGLVVTHIHPHDHGEYRCRVDFGASPTRNIRVKLVVVVPPERLTILSDTGSVLSGVIGPYPVGGNLVLHCRAEGGEYYQLTIGGGENGRGENGGGGREGEGGGGGG